MGHFCDVCKLKFLNMHVPTYYRCNSCIGGGLDVCQSCINSVNTYL